MLCLNVCAGSATVSAVYMSAVGLDTLEEEEEKARFFAQLEAGASSTIDYSKLNRELDSTRSTPANNYRHVSSYAVLHPLSTSKLSFISPLVILPHLALVFPLSTVFIHPSLKPVRTQRKFLCCISFLQ